MIDSDILYFILGAIFGGVIAWRVTTHFHTSVLSDILARAGVTPEKLQAMMVDMQKELGEEPEQTSGLPEVQIKIEKSGEMLYAFRKDNDQFLGQGTSAEALIERMGEKIRDVKLIITPEDGADLLGHKSFNYDTAKKEFSKPGA